MTFSLRMWIVVHLMLHIDEHITSKFVWPGKASRVVWYVLRVALVILCKILPKRIYGYSILLSKSKVFSNMKTWCACSMLNLHGGS